jgi:dTMP kinase
MLVVFEGIDGGGKTTLSNLVAQRLRTGGLAVEHVREGGKFASSVTQAMRELGRDARNFALSPRAELMLYLTREIQLLDEATRPALARADVVIADRFVSTAEVLAVYGRQLPAAEIEPLVTAATGGLTPDLTVLVDVDPRVARARRRVSKILSRDVKPPSRKGLAGTALQLRLRRGYRELAARDPDHWLVIDNTDADLETMADAIADAIRHAREAGVPAARQRMLLTDVAVAIDAGDRASAKAALLAWIDRRGGREPALAAYFLDGLAGPDFDDRRRALAARSPRVIAAGLKGLADAVSWQLRRELATVAPHEVAESIVGPAIAHPEAGSLLRALSATAPDAVGDALWGRDDEIAWALRAELPDDDVMRSLGNVGDPRGWPIRERWLARHGGLDRIDDVPRATLACASVAGVADPRAWEIRRGLRELAPVAALEAVLGLVDDRAWKWRERFLDRAPKVVMKTIAGLDDGRAWQLRDRVASHCEEALDSILGMEDERAWHLREALADTYPASVLKSLGPVATTDRGHALVAAVLARHPADLTVWRQVALHA